MVERAGWAPVQKNNHCPKSGKLGCIPMQVLTGRKHGQSLESLGHGFYGSIVKRSLRKRCHKYPKIHGQTKGAKRLHQRPPLNTPLVDCMVFIMPPPRRGDGGIKRSSASVVRLMSRTSALTRKSKGLGRRNFAQGYPRSHATPTPTSRSKGQKSRSRGQQGRGHIVAATACSKQNSDGDN